GIVKRGPARATAGQTITYTITVRNRGKVRARSVVMRDILPPSMSLPGKTATVKLSKGTAVVSLGNLAPGASKTIKIRVRIDRGVSGLRTNVATASAANAATVRASARTVIAPVLQPVAPAVTG
ncbi:MAG TPA: hypothetical protein VKD47_07135, partial [Miltoncostaeaceae bacterium]|nr:hypothetical protein [Miltoncostaeaceae bacterium]